MAGARDVRLEQIPYEPSEWAKIVDTHPGAEVYQGPGWLSYLAETQSAEPVVASVREGGTHVGYFVGAIVRRQGVRILGSPLSGWGTQCMGFLLEDGFERRLAADALLSFAHRDLGCAHVELGDRRLTADQMTGTAWVHETGTTYAIDLREPEEDLFSKVRSRTRTYVRRGPRLGLTAELTTDVGFADDYYDQLRDVFGRKGLVPTYGVDRVKSLIHNLVPSDQVALLRVMADDGRCIASAVTVGSHETAILWGAASYSDASELHPNELLNWELVRHWKSRGTRRYDMGGAGDYKAQYGAVQVPLMRFHHSKSPLIRAGRIIARRYFSAKQSVAGRVSRA